MCRDVFSSLCKRVYYLNMYSSLINQVKVVVFFCSRSPYEVVRWHKCPIFQLDDRETRRSWRVLGWSHWGWPLDSHLRQKFILRVQTKGRCHLQIGQWWVWHNSYLYDHICNVTENVPCCFELFPPQESKEEYNKTTMDYQMYSNLTYKVLPERLTWHQALEGCDQLGGHLASVHDTDHSSRLNLIAKTDGFPLWIGLSSQDVRILEHFNHNLHKETLSTLSICLKRWCLQIFLLVICQTRRPFLQYRLLTHPTNGPMEPSMISMLASLTWRRVQENKAPTVFL